jgi:hypothetical protein
VKSAFELAMERLQKQAPTKSLSEAQKSELAEVDSLFKAKIAEREIGFGDRIVSAETAGDFAKAEELRLQLVHEKTRLEEEREARKERIRG